MNTDWGFDFEWSRSADGSLKGTLTGHKDGVAAISFSHDGKRVVSSSHDNMIIVWAATGSFHQIAILIGHTYVPSQAYTAHDTR
jgi:WD40 repeat protein